MTEELNALAELVCTFCGKGHKDVKHIIVAVRQDGETRRICNECIESHMELLATMNSIWRDKMIERLEKIIPMPMPIRNPQSSD
jgi:ATP-dependent protease Clp ATPase subunit